MEAKIGGEAHHFVGIVTFDLCVMGKRSLEWDLNDRKWNGDHIWSKFACFGKIEIRVFSPLNFFYFLS